MPTLIFHVVNPDMCRAQVRILFTPGFTAMDSVLSWGILRRSRLSMTALGLATSLEVSAGDAFRPFNSAIPKPLSTLWGVEV